MDVSATYFKLNGSLKVRCESNWSLQPSWSERLSDCDLWYVWAGKGTMTLRDRTIDVRPGVCLWMRPGGLYFAQHDSSDPLGVSAIHFTPYDNQGRPCLSDPILPGEVFEVKDPLFFSSVMFRIVREMRAGAPAAGGARGDPTMGGAGPFTQWLFKALVHELLESADVSKISPWARYRETIEHQVARIHEEPSQVPTVRELAGEAAVSPDHYGRVFRAITGFSPRELIQKARLERASQLLAETPLSISEIAGEAGYADVYQFSRVFKRRMRISPSHWRRSLPMA